MISIQTFYFNVIAYNLTQKLNQENLGKLFDILLSIRSD